MASPTPTSTPIPRSPSFRHGSTNFLVLQEDPYPNSLASLIRRRSTTNLFHWRDEEEAPLGTDLPASRWRDVEEEERRLPEERRLSAILNTPQVRSMRLIGKSKRYRWERYWKTEGELKKYKKPIRAYYERNNMLIQQYLYIDRLLSSSLPHDLLNEYAHPSISGPRPVDVPVTINEEAPTPVSPNGPNGPNGRGLGDGSKLPPSTTSLGSGSTSVKKVKRTPKDIYRPAETTPLLDHDEDEDETAVAPDVGNGDGNGNGKGKGKGNGGSGSGSSSPKPEIPMLEDEGVDSGARIVTVAIYVNFAANAILLAAKIAVVISVPSVSVLASLVDAVLDFLSTAIVWTTTTLISHQDQYRYPVGRRRLEPLGILVFSVIMITSFVQVMLEAIQRLLSDDRTVIELGIPALVIMLSTILIKGLCWLWCRLVKNSSVQALASDALTDVIFNTGSIAFPIVGFYAQIWWLDALGGLLLSLVVIYNWGRTSAEHIKNLSGFSATADQRNILLYLTMRFAKTIRYIQGLQAYHAGDKLIVEVDIVLDPNMSLRDTHDLSESLQYVLESVPIVDRAFVHADYASYNLPTHMEQQAA